MKTDEFESAESEATPREAATDASDVIEMVPLTLHLKSILVPIDFSDTSLKALQYAVPFAKQFGATITLLHVVPPPPNVAEGPYIPLGTEGTLHAAEQHLEKIAESTIGPGFTLRALTRGGFVHDTIIGVARESEVDLIILTTHGYTGFKHLLMGSIAENIVRHAPCPVLVVREKEHEFA